MSRLVPAFAAAFLAFATHAQANEAADTTASLTLARHHTTNALDSPLALPDWYSLMRGSLESTVAHGLGSTSIAGEFELRLFDIYDVENDAAAGLALSTTVRPSETVELRGALSVNLVSEGDDLPVGEFVIGTRTRKRVLGAGLQAGIRLSPDTVLVLEAAASRETPGKTRFQDDLLTPVRLDPARDRFRLAAKLTQTKGAFSYGFLGAAGLMRSDPVGLLPQIRVADHGGRVHGAYAFANGATLSGAAGVELLQLLDGPFRQMRPAYEFVADTPLPSGFSLRGALKGGYDFASSDDPLAVWVRRYEVEAAYRPVASVVLGAGVYFERRDNIGLETRERRRGIYGQAGWQARENIELILRVDATKKVMEGFDFDRRTVDLQLAVTARL